MISVSISSELARSRRAISTFLPSSTPPNFSVANTVHEEAARIFKNTKSEHIKNYQIEGTRGEGIGLMLIEMARKLK